MSLKKQVFKEDVDLMTNKIRQQMGRINRTRMSSRRAGRGGRQPFYAQLLNR